MTAVQHKSIIRRILDEAFNQGNLAIVDELVAPDGISHHLSWGTPANRTGLKQLIAMFRTAFPDLHCIIEDEIIQGDKIVAHWTMRGTHRGPFLGNSPTNKPILAQGLIYARIENGQIVGTQRLYADGKFGGKDGKATFMETQWRGLQAAGKEAEKNKFPFLINNGRTNVVWQNAYLDQENEFVMDRFPYTFNEMNPADMDELRVKPGDLVEGRPLAMADGQPVAATHIAAVTGEPVTEVQASLARMASAGYELDDHQRLVGAALTLRPTAHRIRVRGNDRYAWCGCDTLFLPIRLDEPGPPAQGDHDLEVEVPRLVHEILELHRDHRWQLSIHRGSIQVLPA